MGNWLLLLWGLANQVRQLQSGRDQEPGGNVWAEAETVTQWWNFSLPGEPPHLKGLSFELVIYQDHLGQTFHLKSADGGFNYILEVTYNTEVNIHSLAMKILFLDFSFLLQCILNTYKHFKSVMQRIVFFFLSVMYLLQESLDILPGLHRCQCY